MLNKDKNRKKKPGSQEEIVKRTKKSSTNKSKVISKGQSKNKKVNEKDSNKVNKTNSSTTKKKKVKKPKKPLTPKQIKARNILIGVLTIVLIGGLCAFTVIEYSKENSKKPQQNQQQTQSIDGFTDQQLITAANAYMGNEQYNFKSVLNKEKSNGNLIATLMATEETKGTYKTSEVSVTYENNQGQPLVINMKEVGSDTRTQSVIENSGVVQDKLDVTYKVLGYLKSTGMSINDTNWAMEIYANKTLDGQSGYLIDVYEIQGSVSNSIKWIFVSSSGQMYGAGQDGQGPLAPL